MTDDGDIPEPKDAIEDQLNFEAWQRRQSVVVNPSAIGNPDETPRVRASAAMVAFLKPCAGDAPSRDGYCGGVNGYHLEDCPIAPADAPRFRTSA